MPQTRSGFKQYERAVARKVGRPRIPVTGRTGPGGDPGDIDVPGFYTEVRSRNRARPLRWMREVWEEAHRRGVKPLLVFRGPTPALSPLVVLRWNDFAEVFNRAQRAAGAGPDAERPGRAHAEAAPTAQDGTASSSRGHAADAAGGPRPGPGDGSGG